jgi:hypothetical protein
LCNTPGINHQPTFEVRGTAQVHIAGSEIFTSNIRDQLATAEVSRSLAGKKHSATHANVSCPVTSLKHTHTMKSKSRLATTDPANKRICPRNGGVVTICNILSAMLHHGAGVAALVPLHAHLLS